MPCIGVARMLAVQRHPGRGGEIQTRRMLRRVVAEAHHKQLVPSVINAFKLLGWKSYLSSTSRCSPMTIATSSSTDFASSRGCCASNTFGPRTATPHARQVKNNIAKVGRARQLLRRRVKQGVYRSPPAHANLATVR